MVKDRCVSSPCGLDSAAQLVFEDTVDLGTFIQMEARSLKSCGTAIYLAGLP